MRALVSLAAICLLFTTSCGRSNGSKFLASFTPAATLAQVGSPDHITYVIGGAGESSQTGFFSGVRIEKYWRFSFQGSHAQLSKQLNQLRGEIEGQLTSSGCTISDRGEWSGNFSGFRFHYSSGGLEGLVRVTGVSFESDNHNQGLEILVYEN